MDEPPRQINDGRSSAASDDRVSGGGSGCGDGVVRAATPIGDVQITREVLRDGTLLASIRAQAPPGTKLRTEDEMRESLEATLRQHPPGRDLLVFGYGSLMWNPAIHHVGSALGYVTGWSRKFCLRMFTGRGTPQEPGLMLALDRGGDCHGMVFRIAADAVKEEVGLLWRREMSSGAYDAHWVDVHIDGKVQRALTFVANPGHERYEGSLTPEEAARLIATGRGRLGTCLSYFQSTLQMLQSLGLEDAVMERLRLALDSLSTEEASRTPA